MPPPCIHNTAARGFTAFSGVVMKMYAPWSPICRLETTTAGPTGCADARRQNGNVRGEYDNGKNGRSWCRRSGDTAAIAVRIAIRRRTNDMAVANAATAATFFTWGA